VTRLLRPLPAILRAAGAERASAAALGLIVLVTSFLVAAVPPLLTSRYDAAVRDAVGAPPAVRDVTLTRFRSDRGGEVPNAGGTDSTLRAVAGRIADVTPAALGAVTGPVEYAAATRPVPLPIGAGSNPDRPDGTRNLMLGWDPGVPGRVRYVSGRPPRNPVPAGQGRAVIEVGLAAANAGVLRLSAGTEVPVTLGTEPVVVRVTGLYRPVAAGDVYWPARPGLTAPIVRRTRDDVIIYTGAGVLDAAGYQALYDGTDAWLDFTWRLPVRPAEFTARRADPVADDLGRLELVTANLGVQAQSGLTRLLTDFRGQLRTAQTVLSLALAGLFAVAFGVLALAGRLLAERLRVPLATMRARGASAPQLALGAGAAALLVSLPMAAAGYGLAAVPAPGPGRPAGAVAVLAAATLLPAGHAARPVGRVPGLAGRSDLVRRRATPRRLVLEALVIAVAVAGVGALRSRGLAASSAGGIDPLLALVPVLLGLAAGLLTLRVYPYPLRLAGRLVARSRSVVSFVGVARASRQGLVATLPVLVLLLATAVTAFAGVVDSELRRAQERSAWLTAGADARIDGQLLDQAAAGRIRRVAGVRDVVPAQLAVGGTLGSATSQAIDVTVVAIDLAAYRRAVAGTPLRPPAPPGGAGVPALMSPGLAEQVGGGPLRISSSVATDIPVRPAGTVAGFPATSGDFVIVPYRALGPGARPSTFFVRGTGLDPARLRRAAGGDAIVTSRAAVADRLTGAPLVALIKNAFGYGALVVAGYAALAILLALILGSAARGQDVSYLRTLGLSRGQAQRLAIAELAPVLLCAAVAGWAVGVLLPHVLGPAMDLRAYTGGIPADGYGPDPLMTGALAASLIAFTGLAIAADTLINGRRRLGTTLRMGDRT
jgi:hypothetical protein